MRRLALVVGMASCTPATPTVGPTVPSIAAAAQPATATSIVKAMVETYARARSYEDAGEVSTVFVASDHSTTHTKTLTFTTAFDRARGQFRFEFLDGGEPGQNYIIWSDGAHTYSRWYLDKEAKDFGANLPRALAGATGVSAGAAHQIPSLLMPGRMSESVQDVDAPQRADSEIVDGYPCWRVTGTGFSNTKTVLLIDRESHVLRRIVERAHVAAQGGPRAIGAFDVEQTTTYHPVLDQPIAATRLTPPELTGVVVVPTVNPVWVGLRFETSTMRIVQVIDGAPGALAGVQVGDEARTLDGVPVSSAAEIIQRLQSSKIGATVVLGVSRNGTPLELRLVIAARPEARAMVRQTLMNKRAPDFTAPVMTGTGSATLADLGGHVVILDFWATWCRPCALTFPRLAALHTKYDAKGLRIIGLSDEAPDVIRAFVLAQKLPYTIAQDARSAIAARYLVQGIPMLVVIDQTGVVRHVEIGADLDALEALVGRLLP